MEHQQGQITTTTIDLDAHYQSDIFRSFLCLKMIPFIETTPTDSLGYKKCWLTRFIMTLQSDTELEQVAMLVDII